MSEQDELDRTIHLLETSEEDDLEIETSRKYFREARRTLKNSL